jgi:toxin FitB
MFLSDVAIAEIRFGTEHIPEPARRDMLLTWLKNDVRPRFAGRILPVTEDIFVRWLWITHLGRRKGYTFEQSDALLAATAIHHGLVVVTRDIKPFQQIEVAVLDPWRPP